MTKKNKRKKGEKKQSGYVGMVGHGNYAIAERLDGPGRLDSRSILISPPTIRQARCGMGQGFPFWGSVSAAAPIAGLLAPGLGTIQAMAWTPMKREKKKERKKKEKRPAPFLVTESVRNTTKSSREGGDPPHRAEACVVDERLKWEGRVSTVLGQRNETQTATLEV